jgi:hypothetical protein
MDNLHIYNQARAVPGEALKEIKGGRLNGKSDINPMWRLKKLTELFGPCGIGWKYTIAKQWLEQGGNDEIAAFVNIDLFYKHEGAWSEAIPGTGGSAFVAKEKSGPYTSDECFKMALTDAISVSCKALGFGADVYWDKDRTKYGSQPQAAQEKPKPTPTQEPPKQTTQQPRQTAQTGDKSSEPQQKAIHTIAKQKGVDVASILGRDYGVESTKDLSKKQASELIERLQREELKTA